jgi:hypothetical protein
MCPQELEKDPSFGAELAGTHPTGDGENVLAPVDVVNAAPDQNGPQIGEETSVEMNAAIPDSVAVAATPEIRGGNTRTNSAHLR